MMLHVIESSNTAHRFRISTSFIAVMSSLLNPSYGCAQTLVGGIEDGTTKIPVAGVTDADGVFISNAFPAPP